MNTELNTDRILELADFLDTLPENRFEMSSWGRRIGDVEKEIIPIDVHDCDTVGCVAGWAVAYFRDKDPGVVDLSDKTIAGAARELLGVPWTFFVPVLITIDYNRVKPAMAAQALRNLVSNGGDVDAAWNDAVNNITTASESLCL